MTTHVAIIGAGSVGRALGAGLSSHGTEVVFGVRDPSDPRHQGLGRLASPAEAVQGAAVAVLGGREHFGMVEAHAQLWIHLAFRCGWGRGFAFTVARA